MSFRAGLLMIEDNIFCDYLLSEMEFHRVNSFGKTKSLYYTLNGQVLCMVNSGNI